MEPQSLAPSTISDPPQGIWTCALHQHWTKLGIDPGKYQMKTVGENGQQQYQCIIQMDDGSCYTSSSFYPSKKLAKHAASETCLRLIQENIVTPMNDNRNVETPKQVGKTEIIKNIHKKKSLGKNLTPTSILVRHFQNQGFLSAPIFFIDKVEVGRRYPYNFRCVVQLPNRDLFSNGQLYISHVQAKSAALGCILSNLVSQEQNDIFCNGSNSKHSGVCDILSLENYSNPCILHPSLLQVIQTLFSSGSKVGVPCHLPHHKALIILEALRSLSTEKGQILIITCNTNLRDMLSRSFQFVLNIKPNFSLDNDNLGVTIVEHTQHLTTSNLSNFRYVIFDDTEIYSAPPETGQRSHDHFIETMMKDSDISLVYFSAGLANVNDFLLQNVVRESLIELGSVEAFLLNLSAQKSHPGQVRQLPSIEAFASSDVEKFRLYWGTGAPPSKGLGNRYHSLSELRKESLVRIQESEMHPFCPPKVFTSPLRGEAELKGVKEEVVFHLYCFLFKGGKTGKMGPPVQELGEEGEGKTDKAPTIICLLTPTALPASVVGKDWPLFCRHNSVDKFELQDGGSCRLSLAQLTAAERFHRAYFATLFKWDAKAFDLVQAKRQYLVLPYTQAGIDWALVSRYQEPYQRREMQPHRTEDWGEELMSHNLSYKDNPKMLFRWIGYSPEKSARNRMETQEELEKYLDCMKEDWGVDVNPDHPLILAKQFTTKIYDNRVFGRDRDKPSTTTKQASDPKVCFLVPELVKIHSLPVVYTQQGSLLPTALWILEEQLRFQELVDELHLSTPQEIENVRVAVTCSSQKKTNYELFEAYGDAILELVMSVHLFLSRPQDDGKELHADLVDAVSNRSLLGHAQERCLQRYIANGSYTPCKWLAPGFGEVDAVHVPMKQMADVVEALIGSLFVSSGIQKCTECITWLGFGNIIFPHQQNESNKDLQPSNLQNIISGTLGIGIACDKQAQINDTFNLSELETMIGYSFKSQRSFVKYIMLQYEQFEDSFHAKFCRRLEHLSSALIPFFIRRYLLSLPDDLTPNMIHHLQILVGNHETQAYMCAVKGLAKFYSLRCPEMVPLVSDFIQMCQNSTVQYGIIGGGFVQVFYHLSKFFELLCGLVLLDGGLESAWDVYFKVMGGQLSMLTSKHLEEHPVTKLSALFLPPNSSKKTQSPIEFMQLKESSIPCPALCHESLHAKYMEKSVAIACYYNNRLLGIGYGTTKPRAKYFASKAALEKLSTVNTSDSTMLYVPKFVKERILLLEEWCDQTKF